MMKKILLIALFFTAKGAIAQQLQSIKKDSATGRTVVSTRMTMTGADAKKMFEAMKFAPGIYNEEEKRIDSAEAIRLTKTYEYGISLKTKMA